MRASQTPLEILAIVLKVINKIKIMGKEKEDNILIIFGGLKLSSLGAQRSHYQFMGDVVEKVDNFTNNMNAGRLTEDELKKQE